ncbi:enoyl-CoA hydratase/isomerase family protein [Pedobacter sp. HMF7647]|uniref:Enoyl-CoA hydratase/isomerase family protein n=1 Tax=Hufsiella arboris TaxID=2695275 RepID=A0A7K1Y4H3_9SPHI|nr:enoyl-CoA hydratase/isomerase family protein [Hufsiella arboris]MXV49464.1 enoyl-CoA hydratase/isomerase family protein [Hufsiella arboris]
MNTIQLSVRDKIAYLTLNRGRSNPINTELCNELLRAIRDIESDENIGGLILAGGEGFFSAGADLIELYDYNEEEVRNFWTTFLQLTARLAAFKKPLVAAINGHSPAGGCVMALCADYRVMAEGKYIIGLNEVPVGIIVPNSIFSLYSFWVGTANAHRFLLEGKLLTGEEARDCGLVDELVRPESIITSAERQMKKYLQLSWKTWQQSKTNIRQDLVAKLSADFSPMLDEMLKQWWAPQTRAALQVIIENLKGKSAKNG